VLRDGTRNTQYTQEESIVNPHLLLLLIALLYILVVGGLSALRREGSSLQFAVEVIVVAGLLVVFSLVTGQALHPIVFLIVIYLVTMRARLLVDLGNLLARRGYHHQATSMYNLALKSKPDGPSRQIVLLNQAVQLLLLDSYTNLWYSRQIVLLNQAVQHLKQSQLTQAIAMLEDLLADPQSSLSPKHEAAARYNLAVGYRRQGNEAKAIVEFNKVIDVMPGSLYASGAQIALEKGKRQKETSDSPRD